MRRQCSLATVDATFFASSAAHPPAPRADLIVPISTLANNTGNDASVPPGFSVGFSAHKGRLALLNGIRPAQRDPASKRRRSLCRAVCVRKRRRGVLGASAAGRRTFAATLTCPRSTSTSRTSSCLTSHRAPRLAKARSARCASWSTAKLQASHSRTPSYSPAGSYPPHGGKAPPTGPRFAL